jgi:hypothetical protein
MASARQEILTLIPADAVGAEVGVWKGKFSLKLLRQTDLKLLHLVDPWKRIESIPNEAWYGPSISQEEMDAIYDGVKTTLAKPIENGRVIIHRGNSKDILPTLKDLDFVYIDGDHSYEGVAADLAAAFESVRPGGLICGDDYSLGHWWGDGVVRAVHEFIGSHKVILTLVQGSQFAIRKLRDS